MMASTSSKDLSCCSLLAAKITTARGLELPNMSSSSVVVACGTRETTQDKMDLLSGFMSNFYPRGPFPVRLVDTLTVVPKRFKKPG